MNRHTLASESTILSRLKSHADIFPDKIFITVEISGRERCVTFAEAWQHITACATVFRQAKCPDRGVVLVFLPQGWDAIAFFFGAMLAGYIPSFMPSPSPKQDPTIYWRSHVELLARICPVAIVTDNIQAEAMTSNGLLAGNVALVLANDPTPGGNEMELGARPEQIAFLQHSSGTTGAKKGVMLSHRAVLLQVESYAAAIEANERDIVVSWLPLYHDMGLIACLLMPAILGQTVVLLDPFHWVGRPGSLFRAIATHQATLCWLPNFAFEHLARTVRPQSDEMRLQSVRAFINCSEPCQPETFRRFLEAFANLGVRPDMLQVCYAMAEITFAATQHPLTLPNRVRAFDREALVEQSYTQAPRVGKPIIELLSAGVPITGVEVEIRNKHGDTLPDGVVGEICLRAPFLFSGYFRMPDQTASRLNEGWYQTRDRGFFQDQELYVLGRLDDLLILNGRNYHAAEIEGLLNQITGLKPGRAAAFATANEMRGTSELVIVAETDNSSYIDAPILRHAIREAIFQGIGIYPAEVTVVPPGWLVKTSSGKIARGANAMKHLNSKPIATGKI